MNVDLGAVKTRQQTAWSTGDYAVVGTTLQIVGESLCEALDLRAGSRDIIALVDAGNRSRDGSLVLPSAYLEVVLERA